MDKETLDKKIEDHKKWLDGKGGKKADLRGADLCWANLSEVNLRLADFRKANLCGADLSEANLRKADLRKADLYKADLRKADLRAADLRGAILREADLRGAILRGADLRGVDLYGTELCGADFRKANLTYSCLPLQCSTAGMKIDNNQAEWLFDMIISLKIEDGIYKELQADITIINNRSKKNDTHI